MCRWWEKRRCSMKHLSPLSFMARAISRTEIGSRQLDSKFRVVSVLFVRSDLANSIACIFCKFELDSDSALMCVLFAIACINLGEIIGTSLGSGMSMPVKSKSSNVGSLSQALCTIQTIQSPYARNLFGSCGISARFVMFNTRAAKSSLISMDGSSSSFSSLSNTSSVSDAVIVAVTLYFVSLHEFCAVPCIVPVCLHKVMPSGSGGSTVNVPLTSGRDSAVAKG
mmetsp:Transcript_127713/g.238702  ORF Transcript_127713/g.238702 Transcript_127713/m.238702 type:complete len:225 (+) Transcript_127713:778-1452(+)